MRKIGIMADSHSGILKKEAEELDIHVLPMPFYLNGELFQEDLNFSRKGFYEKLGYQPFGEEFDDCRKMHIHMRKTL